MNTFVIESFPDFLSLIEKEFFDAVYIFRGVSKKDYKLIPKIGRFWPQFENDKERFDKVEKVLLDHFKSEAIPYLDLHQDNSNWMWLSLAQHHGLSTRLLDWTRNPMVAAFFSANQNIKHDGAIYALYKEHGYIFSEEDKNKDPFELKEPWIYIPKVFTPRISAQQSIFTIQPDPRIPLNDNDLSKYKLSKIIIKSDIKIKFLFFLDKYGINKKSLFPGLDGISNWLNSRILKNFKT